MEKQMNLSISPLSSASYRPLTAEECLLIGGGDGEGDACSASCSASDCGSSIGDAAAQALMNQMDLAMTDPIAALAMFLGMLAQGAAPGTGVSSNPMGDPSPGDSGP